MKRILKNLSLLVVALLMVFTTSEVMAQTAPYQSCTFAGSLAGNTGLPYKITIKEPFPIPITSPTDPGFANYPCFDKTTGAQCSFPYFVYAYAVTPMTTGINALTELFPVCQNPFNVLAAVPATNHQLAPGQAENYTAKVSWPLNIWDSYAFTWVGAANETYVITSSPGVDVNSMALKSGSNVYYCNDGILGPGCSCGIAPASILPGNVIEFKKYGPIQVKVERDYITFCIKTMWHCKNSDCTQLEEVLPLPPDDFQVSDSQGNQFFVQCGESSGNQRCPECFIFSEASPGCVYIPSGGTVRKVCQ